MDNKEKEELLDLFNKEYRKERKLNSQIEKNIETTQMLIAEIEKSLGEYTALEYVNAKRRNEILKVDVELSKVKMETWFDAREIILDFKGEE